MTDRATDAGSVAGAVAPATAPVDVGALYRTHYLRLVRLAVQLVDDAESAEDVVQDVFTALLRRAVGGGDRRDIADSAERRRVLIPVASSVAVVAAVAVGVALLPGAGGVSHRTSPAAAATRTTPVSPSQSLPPTTSLRPNRAAPVTTASTPSAPPQPGSKIVTKLAAPVAVTGTGTQTVQLGTYPKGANAVVMQLTCLSAGSFWFGPRGTDGPGQSCDTAHVGPKSPGTVGYPLPIRAGQHSVTVTATSGARWRLVATYAKATISPWGVNANGQSYGVANGRGTPDLIAALATNGRHGYLRNGDQGHLVPKTRAQVLNRMRALGRSSTTPGGPSTHAAPDSGRMSAIGPVYASNGTTVVGVFITGPHSSVWSTASPGTPVASTSCADQNGIGFLFEPVTTFHGAPSPLAAAQGLHQEFGFTGYGTADSSWRVTDVRSGSATATAGAITVHAQRQSDGSWVIVSGQHCR